MLLPLPENSCCMAGQNRWRRSWPIPRPIVVSSSASPRECARKRSTGVQRGNRAVVQRRRDRVGQTRRATPEHLAELPVAMHPDDHSHLGLSIELGERDPRARIARGAAFLVGLGHTRVSLPATRGPHHERRTNVPLSALFKQIG